MRVHIGWSVVFYAFRIKSFLVCKYTFVRSLCILLIVHVFIWYAPIEPGLLFESVNTPFIEPE